MVFAKDILIMGMKSNGQSVISQAVTDEYFIMFLKLYLEENISSVEPNRGLWILCSCFNIMRPYLDGRRIKAHALDSLLFDGVNGTIVSLINSAFDEKNIRANYFAVTSRLIENETVRKDLILKILGSNISKKMKNNYYNRLNILSFLIERPRATNSWTVGRKILCEFSDGVIKSFDSTLITKLNGDLVIPLKDVKYLAKLKLGQDTIKWPNDFEIETEDIYDLGEIVNKNTIR
jgi:hypothetical protein